MITTAAAAHASDLPLLLKKPTQPIDPRLAALQPVPAARSSLPGPRMPTPLLLPIPSRGLPQPRRWRAGRRGLPGRVPSKSATPAARRSVCMIDGQEIGPAIKWPARCMPVSQSASARRGATAPPRQAANRSVGYASPANRNRLLLDALSPSPEKQQHPDD